MSILSPSATVVTSFKVEATRGLSAEEVVELPDYDPNTSCPTGSAVVAFDVASLNTSRIIDSIVPLTLRELIERERLTKTQASRVRDGLRWAERFGLLRHEKWQHYRFDLGDVRTALVLSIIVESARRVK